MPLLIYTWNEHSEGATALKEALGIRKIKRERSQFKGNPRKTVINWGSSTVPDEVLKCNILNHPDAVTISSSKLSFFREIDARSKDIIPPWTTDPKVAMAWIGEGHSVCARTILRGHSAAGLYIFDKNNPRDFVQAPLYTQYIKKQEEYRVHIVDGNVVDLQRKVLRKEKAESGETINWQIRNLDNGFIYQRNNITPSPHVERVAREAMRHSNLVFGAVDVIYNAKQDRAYVLEINTAPGLTGTTVENYAQAFRRYL